MDEFVVHFFSAKQNRAVVDVWIYNIYVCREFRKRCRGCIGVLIQLFGPRIVCRRGRLCWFYSVFAAKRGWRVLAFEPNPVSLVLFKIQYNNE